MAGYNPNNFFKPHNTHVGEVTSTFDPAAEFFGGNFFDKGLEKAKENMEHKDSIQSVVIYITKAIKTMIYEEQKE